LPELVADGKFKKGNCCHIYICGRIWYIGFGEMRRQYTYRSWWHL